jgi:hypothetical protein
LQLFREFVEAVQVFKLALELLAEVLEDLTERVTSAVLPLRSSVSVPWASCSL